ncbi:MAG TPA: NAD-dependent epimerase/dehydratase family protein [Acidimicrobiales bacterium]
MDVGLTGATGHLGGRVLAALLDDPRVDRIRTVARGALPEHPKLVHTRADLCDPAVPAALAGADVVWHLGAQLWRSADGRQIAVNIDGTLNVLAARPAHVVLASSAAVYGAHPDNPLPLTEEHAPRPNAECPYAWHKLEAERLCREAGPCAVLRLCAVLGPHADPAVARATGGYRRAVPAIRGRREGIQFLDEDDAAAGLLAAGFDRAEGTWNLATEDWLDAAGIGRVTGGRVVRLSRRLAVGGSEVGFRLHLLPFGADRAALLDGPLALDPSAARAALGWEATATSGQVLARFLALPRQPAGR